VKETIEKVASWLDSGSINLFGVPYAGKDTQGKELAQLFNATLMGGGDILRNSVVPPRVQEKMDAGELVPIQDYLEIVLPYLSKPDFAGRPLILSAVGRWHGEEEGVMQATEASGHPLKAVIFLTIDDETLRQRWEAASDKGDRGERTDDAAHILAVRLEEFKNKTLPVIETYRQKGLLVEVDGSGELEQVTERIITALASHALASL
jgi:adenylate kinase